MTNIDEIIAKARELDDSDHFGCADFVRAELPQLVDEVERLHDENMVCKRTIKWADGKMTSLRAENDRAWQMHESACARDIEKARQLDELIAENKAMRLALEEITHSCKWGEDTAIKREISRLQDVAVEALAALPKREDPNG